MSTRLIFVFKYDMNIFRLIFMKDNVFQDLNCSILTEQNGTHPKFSF